MMRVDDPGSQDGADSPYSPLFCEENIWRLAQRQRAEGVPVNHMTVVFITNRAQQALLMQQRAAPPGQPLCWDYHVVLRRCDAAADVILDLDTRLPLPTPTASYLAATFPDQQDLLPMLRSSVRLVPAAGYLARFHSDRRHMHGRIAETDFPDYPPITGDRADTRIDLADYRDLERHLDDGSRVLTVTDWRREIERRQAM